MTSVGTFTVGVALSFALLLECATSDRPLSRHVIRADSQYQIIENFGASDCWRMQKAGGWSEKSRERIAALLFSKTEGIGLSCWRFNLGGGINSEITKPWRTAETFETAEGQYDWTRQKNERWFLRAAKERGVEHFMAFVVSPPARMTRNGLTFCDPGQHTTNLKPGFEGQFSRYIADILGHFSNNPEESERINFDYISPINEPQWDWEGHTQEGMRSGNDDIKEMVRALDAELNRRELPTEIVILESGTIPDMSEPNEVATNKYGVLFGNYIDDFIGDPEIAPLLDGRLSYHSYFSDLLDGEIIQDRTKLKKKLGEHPGWKLWQTEYCILEGPAGEGGGGRDLTMDTALAVGRVIHLDLTVASASAWQWWTALSQADFKDGLIYTDYQKPGDPESVIPSKLLWTLGNYSRFVRPGMRRVELDGCGDGLQDLMGSAYLDEDDRKIVAVYLNTSNGSQSIDLDFDLGGRDWHPKSQTLYVTSDQPGDDLKPRSLAASDRGFLLPGRSAVTVVAEFE